MNLQSENNILDVLQLYEYSMSIGKSLNYEKNCDQFLRLILKRKNLNACWILRVQNEYIESQYAIPNGRKIRLPYTQEIRDFLEHSVPLRSGSLTNTYQKLCPIQLEEGYICMHSLGEEGFLFLYSKNTAILESEIQKLSPVINKFSNTLHACRVFQSQQTILQQLEQSNQELNDYAHVVSHDLKSPIRNVETMVSWLEEDLEDQINQRSQKYLGHIRENISKMESLISDILAYSSVGMNATNIQLISVQSCLKSVLEHNFVPENISVEIQDNLPIIQGDKHRIEQLFQNLINNAAKYNDKPQGVIKISYQELPEYHHFTVSDNGIGIDKKYHNKIFQTFQKLHNYKDSTGIGLSIVKRIVQKYGGKIWLESELGKGTTFYFNLHKNPKN